MLKTESYVKTKNNSIITNSQYFSLQLEYGVTQSILNKSQYYGLRLGNH